ncbi:MAG: TonB-dependent receptor [Mucilaginibacter sp.]|nr:TonB-dependent receptor [Mucilaginibacter sp.]
MKRGTIGKNLNKFKSTAFAIALSLIFSAPVYSQKDTSKTLNEVSVKGNRPAVLKSITPVQQITNNDFVKTGSFNVADAVRNFSGVNVKDYGDIGGLKTVSVRGLGANHTAVMYDGVQINDAQTGQVDLSKLNLYNIQQITLYNGQPDVILLPAQAYASASVLNIQTLRPSLTVNKPYQLQFGLKGGSFGLFNPYFQLQQRINNNWQFILNAYTENANGRYKFNNSGNGVDSLRTRTNADIAAQNVNAALYWAKNDSNAFNLHINYYHSGRGLPGPVILHDTTSTKDRLWNEDFFIQAGYRRIWTSGLSFLASTKLSSNYLRYLNPLFLNAEKRLDQQFTQRQFYQSAALAWSISSNWEISYSTDIDVNHLNINFNYPYPQFQYPTRLILLNAIATRVTIGRIKLQASLLNTNVNEFVRAGRRAPARTNLSPTIVASLQPFKTPDLMIRAFYKRIFRNPTFDELYYGGIGNPNLKPEYTNQFDVGFTYNKIMDGILSYITLTTDAYYNDVTNKIVFIPKDAYNGSIQNFGKVNMKGIDIGVKTQAKVSNTYNASLFINYSYLQALNVTNPTSSIYLNQLPYTPKNTLAINAGIDHGALGLYYNQIYSSDRYYTNNNLPADRIPGYSISDASVNYHKEFKKSALKTSIEVNNIFNKGYFFVQSYPMPGRSVRLSFQITI